MTKRWGGRVSEKYITEHSGLLENIVPGDLMLADRGFDIDACLVLYGAKVEIPTFTKGKKQLSMIEVEKPGKWHQCEYM